MIKNKCKKIISTTSLIVMVAYTSVNVFAGSSSSKVRQPLSDWLQMSESGSYGKNITRTGELTITDSSQLQISESGSCEKNVAKTGELTIADNSPSKMCEYSTSPTPISESDSCEKNVTEIGELTIADDSPSKMHEPSTSQTIISESGSCGENVTYSFNVETGELTIAGDGEMKNYSDLDVSPWESYRDKIKSIKIKNGVTTIGDYAFDGCKYLTEISVGSDVTWIGENAFRGFTDLTIIYLDSGVLFSTEERLRKSLESSTSSFMEHTGLEFNTICRVDRFGNCDSDSDFLVSCTSESDEQPSELSLNQIWECKVPESDSSCNSDSSRYACPDESEDGNFAAFF